MSLYNITGWSGGGRRPLTYNLRAGQFRNMGGVNVFGTPTRTIINNNFGGGYGYGCDCYSDCGRNSGVPSWMQWTMGGGMIMNFLGQMMSAIFPAKESKEADGKGGAANDHKEDMAKLQALVKDKYTISGPIGDKFCARDKETGKVHQFNTFAELQNFVINGGNDETEPTKTTSPISDSVAEGLITGLKSTYPEAEITFKDGKFKYTGGDEETIETDDYSKLKEFISAHPPKKKVAASVATPVATAATNSVKLKQGQQWYDIALKHKPANVNIREAIGQLERANGLNLTMDERRTNNRGPAEFAKEGMIILPEGWKTATE